MEQQTLVLVMERKTNGKLPVVGTLYVQRWALGQPLEEIVSQTSKSFSITATYRASSSSRHSRTAHRSRHLIPR